MLRDAAFEPPDPGLELGESIIATALQGREPFVGLACLSELPGGNPGLEFGVELVDSRLIEPDGTSAPGHVSEGHRSSWDWAH